MQGEISGHGKEVVGVGVVGGKVVGNVPWILTI